MKTRAFGLALATLILPVVAWANGIDLTNHFGTVTITNAGISSYGSQLLSFGGITTGKGHSLGTVSFSTGGLVSGSIWTGGTFSSVGSSFVVTGSGKLVPHNIFVGSFISPISWSVIGQYKQFVEYKLSGIIRGQLYTGYSVTGTTTQYIYTYTNQRKWDNKGNIHLGTSQLVAPEPGSLGMLGTGLVLMAGAFRRRFLRS